jgi:hypothetical protein
MSQFCNNNIDSAAHINATPWHKGQTTLGIAGLVFRQEFKFVVLIFKVSNVSITVTVRICCNGGLIKRTPFPLGINIGFHHL